MTGPDATLALGDPGDDTARRYHYQWTYAAVMCCMILDSTEDVMELFCEQHEDVLLKHSDNTFSGLQLKTRDEDQRLWSTTDDDLVSSFAKFARHEHQYPGHFRAFRFLTNHPLQSTKNGKDICRVLQVIQEAASAAVLPRPVLAFLKKVARAAGCSEEVAFAALRKSTASSELPKRGDIEARLVSTLEPVWERANECSHASLQRAAKALVAECGRASSLAHEGLLPAYMPASVVPGAAQLAALAFKRFERGRVLRALEDGFASTAPLAGDTAAMTAGSSGSPALLTAKLEAGGFSVTSINSATDLRDKADYLALVWTKKHGEQQGLRRQDHVRSIALRDAASAFETSQRTDRPFGIAMLQELRRTIRERRARPGEQLHDCSDEHLEGFVYGLTSECLVMWSTDRPWERRDEHR